MNEAPQLLAYAIFILITALLALLSGFKLVAAIGATIGVGYIIAYIIALPDDNLKNPF